MTITLTAQSVQSNQRDEHHRIARLEDVVGRIESRAVRNAMQRSAGVDASWQRTERANHRAPHSDSLN